MRSPKPPAKPPNVTTHPATVTVNRSKATIQIKLQPPVTQTPAERRYSKSPTIAVAAQKRAALPAPTATIKAPPPPLVRNAMEGLRNPLSQGPKERQSVDGRVGADAAAAARAGMRGNASPASRYTKPRSPTR